MDRGQGQRRQAKADGEEACSHSDETSMDVVAVHPLGESVVQTRGCTACRWPTREGVGSKVAHHEAPTREEE